ncbi:MAG: DUF488 domain-containing protein [Rhodobacteraceae bacterium]|nr:DUF488 domain-containing protein [Paracoccaceae bacterium]
MQSPLCTIVYEKTTPHEVIATLHAQAVGALIDVRALPISRKPGFAKRALAQALGEAGIAYHPMPALGNPKPGRQAARRGDFQAFRRLYQAHLYGEAAQRALLDLIRIASRECACLMCFERDHAICHRTLIAEAVAARAAITLQHLKVDL